MVISQSRVSTNAFSNGQVAQHRMAGNPETSTWGKNEMARIAWPDFAGAEPEGRRAVELAHRLL